jgi:thymidylate synthase ThyX
MNDAERALLAPYVSNLDGDVFALRNLPEEVAAVLFAYYSRSSDGLRQNLLRLLADGDLDVSDSPAAADAGQDDNALSDAKDRARAFHEKWVVGYGHSSVAEHAVIRLAVENVSILTSKVIEDCRLASYTEKSTRYVKFDTSRCHYPPRVMADRDAGARYRGAIERLMGAYVEWQAPVLEWVRQHAVRSEKQTERGFDTACKATAFDNLRYLLPACTFTNIGITANARSLEGMIVKLLSHPLDEARAVGEQIRCEAQTSIPTLLKYADPNEYRAGHALAAARKVGCSDERPNGAHIVGPYLSEPDVLDLIALHGPFAENDPSSLLAGRGKHDPVPRCFERAFLTFELILDYGAFRDIQRHRMATITVDALTACLGFETPPAIQKCGLAREYGDVMGAAGKAWQDLRDAGFETDAPYVLPLGYRVRTLLTANLREIFHLVELRSGRQGHPSYRRIAQGIWREVDRVYPSIARHIRVNMKDYALTRD